MKVSTNKKVQIKNKYYVPNNPDEALKRTSTKCHQRHLTNSRKWVISVKDD